MSLKKSLLGFILNIGFLYILTPILVFFIYTFLLANSNYFIWFDSLNLTFINQTQTEIGSGSGLEYLSIPLFFFVCIMWIFIESIFILLYNNTIVGKILRFEFKNTNLLRTKLGIKTILKHVVLLFAHTGYPTINAFYYPNWFTFYVWSVLIIADLLIIFTSQGRYAGLNLLFGLKYKKDPILIGSGNQ